MKKDVLLSFVIPVYNVEKYLRECVESILGGMTDECEIILVNDGSEDSSGDICTEYAGKDDRIHVIHKENGGLSSARNAGLLLAKGEYVTFVDSDDKIFSDSVADILHWIVSEGTDMCFLKAEKFYPDGTKRDMGEGIVREQIRSQNREAAISHLTSRPKYPGSAWAKLFRREFLTVNDLHFPRDRRYSEDLGFIRDCIFSAESFDFLDVPFYQYRQNRQGSITNKISAKSFYDLLMFISESCEKLTVDKKACNPIDAYLMRAVAYEYSVLLLVYSSLSKDDKKKALAELKKFKWVMKYAVHIKVKVIAFVCLLFGPGFASLVTNRYRRITTA